MSRTFEFYLSESSINDLVKKLEKYQKELQDSKKYILEALADYAYSRVKENIINTVGKGGYPSTDTLLNSIEKSPIMNDMISVYTDLAYAKYVEFGTGIVGSNNPHPQAAEQGWSYDKQTGWRYIGSDGNSYYTEGLEPHQFMYNAWIDLKNNYIDIARKVLKERGLI